MLCEFLGFFIAGRTALCFHLGYQITSFWGLKEVLLHGPTSSLRYFPVIMSACPDYLMNYLALTKCGWIR